MDVTKFKVSPLSRLPATREHTLIFGYGLDELAREDGLLLPVIEEEHRSNGSPRIFQIHGNPMAEGLSRLLGQVIWEKNAMEESGCNAEQARDSFYRRYGRVGNTWNWL